MAWQNEIVVDSWSVLGEGSFWDSKNKLLYWLDIESRFLNIFNPCEKKNKQYKIGEKIGTVVPRERGGLILALENSIAVFNTVTGIIERLIPLEENIPYNRLNDGKCDAAGRFWIGSIAPEDHPGKASLYRIDPDLSVHKMLSDITISNGIVWSHDSRKMFYIDTPTRQIDSFDYDLDTGTISNRSACVEIPKKMGYPDGMSIDEEGMLWVALFAGWGVSRWDPATGKMIDYVKLPVKNVTSCAFGGENLNELYITTARISMTEQELTEQPHSGSLFRVETKVRGVALHSFAG